MKSILVNSLLVLALCCSCRAKEKIVLEKTEASRLEARHEAIDYNITISDVIVDDSGKTSIKPIKQIKIKGNKVDTTQSESISNKIQQQIQQPIQNTNKTKSDVMKILKYLSVITVLYVVLALGIIAIVLILVKRL